VADAGGLARALRRLLLDEQLRRAYAAAGSARVARYDWRRLAGRVVEVYDTAIAATSVRVREAAE
jgi:phosphatidylinositol alpha-mannosyltransferase